jgi:hypothetical protein
MTRSFLTAVLALVAAPAFADSLAMGAQITEALADNTVQGSMMDSGAYTEFYQADGVIKGDGYTAKWSIKDDKMCFDYGEGDDCWSVRLDGANVTWVKDGADKGTGTIVAGNPNNF